MKVRLLLFALLFNGGIFAQDTDFIILKAGTNVKEVLSPAAQFYYPDFKQGRVHFKDGTKGGARLNYYSLLDEIHFIDQKGDTLALANEINISFIAIDNDSFYFDEGYVRVIAGNNMARLAVKQAWGVEDIKRMSAFHTNMSKAAVTNYIRLGEAHKFAVNEDVHIRKTERFYFGDKNNRFVMADKKNLLKLFPKERGSIEIYLQEHKIDFDKREDLEKMVEFMARL